MGGLGLLVGAVVGVLIPLPLALFLRHWLDLPEINATPGKKDLTVTYWLPWTLSWLAANLPGVALILWPRTRRAGRWFLAGSLVTSTPISWFYFGLEYYGVGLN
ncbi:hypothetical protein [Gordonia polyisoprenivorans]|uniref:hypothetical protein n=1 Tax=Gordonia polyisoprenivorans TaxID=84595 RepID=UPI001AD7C155|nr:hypothetical protein [Gordonia polyisoprenivorans]QTI69783.1 hypothetical protein J6U32_04035 [Gordonia polyisoprenivorans]